MKTNQKQISASLQITTKDKTSLSKCQETFNKLTKRIEKLEDEIVKVTEKMQKLQGYFNKEVFPTKKSLAEARVELATQMDKTVETHNFSQSQKNLISEAIITLLDEAFCDIEPNEIQEALYDKWSDSSYKEGVQEQEGIEKELFANFINNTFGTDFGIDDFENTPEGRAIFQEKLKEKAEQHHQFSKKTKKQRKKKPKNLMKNSRTRTFEVFTLP